MRGETQAEFHARMRAKAAQQRRFDELEAAAAASQGRARSSKGPMPVLTWERPNHVKFLGDCKLCGAPMVSAYRAKGLTLDPGVRIHNSHGICRNHSRAQRSEAASS